MTFKWVGGVGNTNFSYSPLAEEKESVMDGTRSRGDENVEE